MSRWSAASVAAACGLLMLSTVSPVAADTLPRSGDAAALGRDVTVRVVDVASGDVVFAERANEPQVPASTMKVITAASALSVFSPRDRFVTRVTDGADGKSVVLVGGGDPLLSSGDVDRLAEKAARQLRRSGITAVRVDWDTSLFPPHRDAAGWVAGDVPTYVSAVSPLTVHGVYSTDPTAAAVSAFTAGLSRRGVKVRRGGDVTVPPVMRTVASVSPHTVADAVDVMLTYSDNNVAEVLFRDVAKRQFPRREASWRFAADVAYHNLLTSGVNVAAVRLVDGSGVSSGNRLPARVLTDVLAQSFEPSSRWRGLRKYLPAAGAEGTLMNRFTGSASCGRGRVWAKTGSLTDVNTLAGVVKHRRGWRVFAVMVNGQSSSGAAWGATSAAVDRIAATASGCR